ncbi:MAG: DUF1015 family protein [Defluviitaleaceae bacterium]|nr:DUF1015 family protein [Defluviitaleaceae bacterium]
MAIIRPFKGVRPRPDLANTIAALPYDVMSSMEAREMVKDNPLSFLYIDRPELNFPPGHDMYTSEVYRMARTVYNKMKSGGQFIQDEKSVYYIYRQTMNGRAQTGLVAATSIDDYMNNVIKKHELTRKEKEEDRIRHVNTMDANTGPIFLTYRNQPQVTKLIEDWAAKHTPVYDFVSEDKVGHTVWVVDDAEVISKLTAAFLVIVDSLYIADGHHRNASAVAVGLERRLQNPDYTMDDEFNYYLSVIFPDSELAIMDYNRVVKDLNGLTLDEYLAKIKEKFQVEDWSKGAYKPEARHTFGMYHDKKWYKLTAKPEFIDENDPVESLDVSILQSLLLTPILDIQDPRTDLRIDFVGGLRGLSELERRVDSGNMAVAFSMFPTSMDELMAISDADKLMPPKSTWFEPKLRSGLFVHELR